VGPGAYNAEAFGSLESDMKTLMARGSKKQPAFGATGPQRGLPFLSQAVPGPGSYDSDQPRQMSAAGSAFKSETKRLEVEGGKGDPGAYDPFAGQELADESTATFNKTNTPFGATAKRELSVNIYGADTPGPGKYEPTRAESATDANRSVFASGSAQRPASDQLKTPGAGTYDPDINAVKRDARVGAVSMGGKFDRFKQEAQMTEDVGPGAYNAEAFGSLESDMKTLMAKGSKKKPGFGTTGAQRGAYQKSDVPAPGSYQPLSPRFKSPSKIKSTSPKRKGSGHKR